ncbi:hypothetical protein [Telmatospirillum siberiense]|uniref:Uncharacterized protein n=1 Tax=Telmatospirillum siberiense TaxID=382514 RepID=A0A2N3Q038_9PROT|nr:hypothetical protein [Telmatospirillum siberiense]PKU26020.1 hypothetical protein CWS72_02430 [Telmatospirillum siberiense]
MTSAEETREELAKVSSLAMTARRLLAGGKLVDLAALEERVRILCGTVQAMPREEGQSLLDDMRSLINKLDQLRGELELRLTISRGDAAENAGGSDDGKTSSGG